MRAADPTLMADLMAILCRHHVGALRAATGRVLLERLRRKRPGHHRRVGEAVAALIDIGVPIASSSVPPFGYFVPANESERKRACRELDGRIAKLAQRKKAFMRAGRPTKQLSFKIGGAR